MLSDTPESLLRRWVAKTRPDWSLTRVDLVLQRLGWTSERVPSLEEVGQELGITRQSAHEMIERLLGSLEPLGEELVAYLDRALAVVLSLDLPLPTDVVTKELKSRMGQDTHPASAIISVFKAADMNTALRVEAGYVLKKHQNPPDIDELLKQVRNEVRLNGFVDIRVLGDSSQLPPGLQPVEAIQTLERDTGLKHVIDEYYVGAGPSTRGRLVFNTEKLLAVTSPMRLALLTGGLDRQTRAGRLPRLPEEDTLASLLRAVGFVVVEDLVDCEQPLSTEMVLSHVERLLYEWLDVGDLRTSQLRERAAESGVPERTLVHFLSYSPIIESRGRGRWGLRGRRGQGVQTPRSSPQVSYSWSQDGDLVLRALIGSGDGVVVLIPEPVRPMLSNRHFKMKNNTTLSISDGRFVLRANQYSERRVGGWLELHFDLASNSVSVK